MLSFHCVLPASLGDGIFSLQFIPHVSIYKWALLKSVGVDRNMYFCVCIHGEVFKGFTL